MAITISWLTGELRRRLLLGLPLPTVALGVLLTRALESPAALREASGAKETAGVLDAWAQAGLTESVRTAISVDFAFIGLWAVWLALCCLWVADQRSGRLRWAGWIFAAVALLGGIMAVVTDLSLLQQLGGAELSTGLLLQASAGGVIRDIALGLVGLFILGGAFLLALLPQRPPGQPPPKRAIAPPIPEAAPPVATPVQPPRSV